MFSHALGAAKTWRKGLIVLFLILIIGCVTGMGLQSKGGGGSSYEQAVIISTREGVAAEYKWIRKNYPGCKVQRQALAKYKDRRYDILDCTTDNGEKKRFYFDITDLFRQYDKMFKK